MKSSGFLDFPRNHIISCSRVFYSAYSKFNVKCIYTVFSADSRMRINVYIYISIVSCESQLLLFLDIFTVRDYKRQNCN